LAVGLSCCSTGGAVSRHSGMLNSVTLTFSPVFFMRSRTYATEAV
jgi:hypothetical protein